MIPEATTLRIERAYHAPAQAVFDAWTSEEVLRRWFHAEHDWETTEAKVDLRIGGVAFGSEAIGVARSPEVAFGYLAVAAILLACARYAVIEPRAAEIHHPQAMSLEPAE